MLKNSKGLAKELPFYLEVSVIMWEYLYTNILGVLSLVVAIIIPILLAIKSRKRKELSYEISSSTSLIVSDKDLKSRLTLYECVQKESSLINKKQDSNYVKSHNW
ncbi:hypothetical protein ACOI1C_22650 [Bacillus sp. DJP31]|uniref:hypothetical protein n=1 Tax=Bacillus sp. DJP31 TaxID=3409789 RepID=UPI003BB65785